MMPSSPLQQQHAALKAEVEAALQSMISGRNWPESLHSAIQYSLLDGGKRLRPALALMAAEVCGGDRKEALPAACALEMVHTYSLIHDDLPAMDDDDMRRGRPSSHKVFGEALAILTGDALLTLAFEVLATAPVTPSVKCDCICTLTEAAGAAGMIGGQVLDLEAERGSFLSKNAPENEKFVLNGSADITSSAVRTEGQKQETDNPASASTAIHVEQLIQIHRMKTGALITAALEMGAAVAQASENQRAGLRKFGQSIGLAFQIADDLLDVTGDNHRLGKETGRDNELGKLTYPSLIGIEESRRRAYMLVDEAIAALDIFDDSADLLRQLARFIVERDH